MTLFWRVLVKLLIPIIAGNWQEVLREHIDPKQLPVVYGGTLTDPDGDPRCRTMVRERNRPVDPNPIAGSPFGIKTERKKSPEKNLTCCCTCCCCRSIMAARCPSLTMCRTLWRLNMTTVWASAAAPVSSWNMLLKRRAACWGKKNKNNNPPLTLQNKTFSERQ